MHLISNKLNGNTGKYLTGICRISFILLETEYSEPHCEGNWWALRVSHITCRRKGDDLKVGKKLFGKER
jgi:hypothetical protein